MLDDVVQQAVANGEDEELVNEAEGRGSGWIHINGRYIVILPYNQKVKIKLCFYDSIRQTSNTSLGTYQRPRGHHR